MNFVSNKSFTIIAFIPILGRRRNATYTPGLSLGLALSTLSSILRLSSVLRCFESVIYLHTKEPHFIHSTPYFLYSIIRFHHPYRRRLEVGLGYLAKTVWTLSRVKFTSIYATGTPGKNLVLVCDISKIWWLWCLTVEIGVCRRTWSFPDDIHVVVLWLQANRSKRVVKYVRRVV